MSIEVRNVWKRYGRKWALRDLSLDIPTGRVVGLLGENGSGKSTLLRTIAGVTRPSKGTVSLSDQPLSTELKKQISFVTETDSLYPWMRVRQQQEFLSSFYPSWDAQKCVELTKLMQIDLDAKIGELSRGQRGRLAIALAFSRTSPIVLLDEPFGGIDPPSRLRILKTLIDEFREEAQTILVTTHLVSEVEGAMDDVYFIREGEITVSGNADALRAERGQSLNEIFELP